jgi:uncharacterized protein (TIGR03067 family)
MNASICLLALSLWLPAADPKEDAKKDQEKMQGTWKVEKLMRDGMEAPADIREKMTVTITGNKMSIKIGEGAEESEFTLDPSTKPAHFDFKLISMKEDTKTRYGLYKFDGESLTLCWTRGGGERPKDFESKPGSLSALFALKKEKK